MQLTDLLQTDRIPEHFWSMDALTNVKVKVHTEGVMVQHMWKEKS